MIKATAQAIEGFGFISKKATSNKNGVREVRGFVSASNMDRHGDMIDPVLFDVESFSKNPQLFIDHDLWINKNGNRIPPGRVEQLTAAKAVEDGSGGFNIVSIEDDEVIDHVPAEEASIVENDMKGLWGVISVMENDVIELIDTGRLNAFSWRGDLVETRFGKHIDLMEVSLVFIPANSKALFMVTKSAVRSTDSFVIVKGGNVFADITKLPDNVSAVIDKDVPKYCIYVKKENGRVELTELSLTTDKEADAFSASVYAARADVESVTLLKHTFLMTDHGEPIYEVMNDLSRTEMIRSEWSRSMVNDLPDSAFAYIEEGGEQDSEGKTVPRTLRHFPIKDKSGRYDETQVKSAMARVDTSEFGDKAKAKIMAAARALGIETITKSATEGGQEETPEGGEDMDVETINSAVAAAVSEEFKKVLGMLDEKLSKSETPASEASAEEKPTEVVVEKAKEEAPAPATVDVDAITGAIAGAIKEALGSSMDALSKRIEQLETKPVVESQQASEVEESRSPEAKSLLEKYAAITDKDEKSKARQAMLALMLQHPDAVKS